MLKNALIPILVALSAASILEVAAQNQQNWEANQAGQIQRDYASGLINQNQAVKMESRDAQIEAQTQQDMNQNGGKLTGQEKGQINSELKGLNQRTGGDVRRDNPNANFNSNYSQQGRQWENRNGFHGNLAYPSNNMQNSQNNGNYPNQRHRRNRFNQEANQGSSPQFWQH